MNKAGRVSANFLQGLPFVGEYTDEAIGAVSDAIRGDEGGTGQDAIRRAREYEQLNNPVSSTVTQVAGGVAGAVPAVLAAAPVVNSSKICFLRLIYFLYF